jgi:hypothetical protein
METGNINGPFHLKSTPPMDEVSKILTPKKKDQSADTKPPLKFVNFPLTPQKNRRDQSNKFHENMTIE